jgi:hypothetical protein
MTPDAAMTVKATHSVIPILIASSSLKLKSPANLYRAASPLLLVRYREFLNLWFRDLMTPRSKV